VSGGQEVKRLKTPAYTAASIAPGVLDPIFGLIGPRGAVFQDFQ